jgi:hypothetical protein
VLSWKNSFLEISSNVMAKAGRQRKSVEIYFVLYLVALVLLMPDRQDQLLDGNSVSASQLRMELFPEKVRLECSIERDSLGPVTMTSADTVNVIRYSPAMSRLRVRATIEDVENGQTLTIDDSLPEKSGFASIRVVPERGIITFSWSPLMASMSSKTFRVTLQATGAPIQGKGRLLSASGSTQFVLTTIVNNQLPPQVIMVGGRTDTLLLQDTSGKQFAEQLSSEFWIEPARTTILSAAGKEWINRLSIGGADPARDLQSLPAVRVISGPQVDVVRYVEQRTLIVKGKAPVNGTSVIEVSAVRTDGKQARQTFAVQTVVTATPRVPDVVYPGVEIVIDPLLPSVESARAYLRDGSREIVSASAGNVRYRPAPSDTGKVLMFERLIDGQVDFSAPIVVRSFPAPVIREIRRGSDANTKTVIVQFYSADRSVNRPVLKVVDGNATGVRKLAGYLRQADNQKPAVSWIEVFEVIRKDQSKPFTFRIQAFDERGRGSAVTAED